MRSLKISEDTDYNLEALKLLIATRLKKRFTKGEVVRYALKTLADKLDAMMDRKKDGEK